MGTQNVLGVDYPYPDGGDKPWDNENIGWTTAVSNAINAINADVQDILLVQIPFLQSEIDASGQANTASNQGGGVGLVLPKVGVDLPFKTLVAGPGVTITALPDTVQIEALTAGDVTGPVASQNGNIATFNGTTGKLIKLSGVNIDPSDNVTIPGNTQIQQALTVALDALIGGNASVAGNFGVTGQYLGDVNIAGDISVAGLTATTPNQFWQTMTRPGGNPAGVRGIARSARQSITVLSGTGSLGTTATLTTTGRRVFVGLWAGDNDSYIFLERLSGTDAMVGVIRIRRDGVTIYNSRFGASADAYFPASGFWTTDENGAAGTYSYTCEVQVLNPLGETSIQLEQIGIIAYEL